jgi:hypothetical protein
MDTDIYDDEENIVELHTAKAACGSIVVKALQAGRSRVRDPMR